MFPAFSMTFVQDRARTEVLYDRSVKFLLFCLFPIIVSVIVLANDGLRVWVGPDFAQHSTRVLQLLAAGVFINCLAQAPFALVQGIGRPDLSAKLHLLELPGYLLALWYLSKRYGIDGAAFAWTARTLIDALVLFVISKRFLPQGSNAARDIAMLAASLVIFMFAAQMQGLIFKGVFLLLTLIAFVLVTWFVVFSRQERKLIQEWL
jgi:O-antigen/teichoic acid export membrane protein